MVVGCGEGVWERVLGVVVMLVFVVETLVDVVVCTSLSVLVSVPTLLSVSERASGAAGAVVAPVATSHTAASTSVRTRTETRTRVMRCQA